ncbi:hypothetical protein L873DRAFT_1789622 [Choiromyces venosus 120613-1]|uniref:Uncharacterized protein n=1 Tax=Choiromyces venosus 120613-1 TaxID=1336337 RepID=A0A3N4JRL1_9PEZI|nr:hypothetical protein L873DRAFT_1789622 [Choiromyces venosus 120613-1]
MITISTSYSLHSDLQDTEFMSQHLLEEVLLWKGHQYHLRLIEGIGPRIDRMKESNSSLSEGSTRVLALSSSKEAMRPVKREPEWELTIAFGAAVLICFVALWTGLVYLFIYDKKHKGVPRIGGASFVSRLLFAYLPTLIAVSIEPLWVLLGRYACMVTPFERLNREALAAFSFRSTLVGVLASAILLANLLAVALGGLFEPLMAVKLVNDNYYNNISVPAQERLGKSFPELQILPEPEAFYVLWGNLSGHHELPQWTSEKYYFLPQVSTKYGGAPGHQEVVKRRVKTRGFGAELPSGELSKAEMVGLTCSQELRTVEAWVDVSSKETILSVEPLPNTEGPLSDSFFSADALATAKMSEIPVQSSLDLPFRWGLANSGSKLNRTLGTLFTGELDPSFEPHPPKWINHLMQLSDPTMNRQETHLPNEATLAETFEKILTSLFAIYLSIHSQPLFLPPRIFCNCLPHPPPSSYPSSLPIPRHRPATPHQTQSLGTLT